MTDAPALFHRLAGAAAVTFAALLAACGGNAEEDSGPVNAGFVRLVNATPASLALYDINTGTTIAGATAYGGSAYADRVPETHDFVVLDAANAQVATLTAGVARQERYTLVAARSGNGYATVLLTDNETAPSSGAKLRVHHAAAADVGNVDVYLAAAGCTGLSGPAFANANGLSAFKTVTAGVTVHLCVTAQGDASDLRLDIPNVTFGTGQVVTLVLARGRGGVLVDGVLVTQRGAVTAATNGAARIRLAADITAGTTVVASANGMSLGGTSTAPAIGGYVLVPAGTVNVGATLGGTDTTLTASPAAVGGGDYTLLLTGTAAAPTASLLADDNTPSTSTANPVKLRLVHGVNGAAGSASFDYESAFVASASFGTASATALRPTTTGAPSITATLGATTIPVSTTSALGAGRVYTLFLLGSAAAPVAKLVQDR